MADDSPAEGKTISFSVKASSDQKFSISISDGLTVLELKQKLSTSEYADLPAERQRLIYSGRVLKDSDKLASYNIKDGNTVHMVKSAAAQRPAPTSSSGAGSAQQNPAAAGIPTNIASGTGGDPLAALTGARYAGFAQMPGANTFGVDGGMGAPPGPDELLHMLDNPMFQSQMNEAMNNPDVIRMMTNNPMIQQNPFLRNALQNPEFRRMLMNPEVIRSSMQMSRMMGGQGQGQSAIAPGVTDSTPQSQGATTTTTQPAQQSNTTSLAPQFNPFQFMGQGQGQAHGQNPFAALFGGGMDAPAPAATGFNASTNTQNTTSSGATQNPNQQGQQANPFASFMGGDGLGGGQPQQNDALSNMMQSMLANPQLMQQTMQSMQSMYGGAQGQQGPQGQQAGGGAGGFNPFALLGQGGFGGLGAPPAQSETRPPEEQYAEQLRQLNEMGFYEFERNVRALRMAGGSVQGAVEMLLGGGV